MQIQLPFFPASVKHFNPHVGVFRQDDFVYYMHNGSPLFCHDTNDRNSYRYITGNLVEIKLCNAAQVK